MMKTRNTAPAKVTNSTAAPLTEQTSTLMNKRNIESKFRELKLQLGHEPNRIDLARAGKFEVLRALEHYGGLKGIYKLMGWESPKSEVITELQDFEVLRPILEKLIASNEGFFPSINYMLELGLNIIYRAILYFGGQEKVAKIMGATCRSKKPGGNIRKGPVELPAQIDGAIVNRAVEAMISRLNDCREQKVSLFDAFGYHICLPLQRTSKGVTIHQSNLPLLECCIRLRQLNDIAYAVNTIKRFAEILDAGKKLTDVEIAQLYMLRAYAEGASEESGYTNTLLGALNPTCLRAIFCKGIPTDSQYFEKVNSY